MIKISTWRYIQFARHPNMDMMLAGWEWEQHSYLFDLVSIITYTKKSKF